MCAAVNHQLNTLRKMEMRVRPLSTAIEFDDSGPDSIRGGRITQVMFAGFFMARRRAGDLTLANAYFQNRDMPR
jgi:hypothetical protein